MSKKAQSALPSNEELLSIARAIIVDWQQLLGLQNWHIEVDMDDSEGDELPQGTIAYTQWPTGYKHVQIKVMPADGDPAFYKPERFEYYILHELVHLIPAELCDFAETLFGHGTLSAEFTSKVEGMVDVLAAIFIRLKGK